VADSLRGTKPDTTKGFAPCYQLSLGHRDAAEAIQRLDGALGAQTVHPDFLLALRERAASLNTHATTSLEGNPLSQAEVEALAARPQKRLQAPEQLEVLNHLRYHASLAKVPPTGPLGAGEMLATHAELLRGVLPAGVGAFKTSTNVIADEMGREVFYPTPPPRVEGEIEALLRWYDASPLPTPIRVAIWVHEFFSIHPFRDGNGRVGRALTHRLLLAAGFRGMAYVALDAEFLANRRAYMDAIRSVQTDRWDHGEWVTFFLSALQRAYTDADAAVRGQGRIVGAIQGLPREILDWVLLHGGSEFGRAALLAGIPDYHDVSVSHALTGLVASGHLVATGAGRARKYRPGPRFREAIAGLGHPEPPSRGD